MLKPKETEWLERVQEKTILFKRKYSLLVKENLEPLGVTPFQLQILWILGKDGEMGTTQLADKLKVKPSAVTMGTNQLHKRGWLNRIHLESDRRQIRITLTAEGERLLKEAKYTHNELASELFSCFNERELADFYCLVDKLEQNTFIK
ncbi:MarR family transcriptional regulator [Metabacillus sp. KIGAM252]|uniref:MarR family transcriptional regulator n=1 Tax=Metabacillus flavus TaxID=2823519 RepID=A0ABS5LHF9_9BACI|nr:MarR family transcriptional regulator [Metabacillus flavus]MBS2970157.1 MarR family transcriptional regulator [Metabacillus flavus]